MQSGAIKNRAINQLDGIKGLNGGTLVLEKAAIAQIAEDKDAAAGDVAGVGGLVGNDDPRTTLKRQVWYAIGISLLVLGLFIFALKQGWVKI